MGEPAAASNQNRLVAVGLAAFWFIYFVILGLACYTALIRLGAVWTDLTYLDLVGFHYLAISIIEAALVVYGVVLILQRKSGARWPLSAFIILITFKANLLAVMVGTASEPDWNMYEPWTWRHTLELLALVGAMHAFFLFARWIGRVR